METKIAIISDIHSNKEALKVVLDDIKKRNINHIICLGDIIGKGTYPNECVNLIKKHCFVAIAGNNDRFYAEDHDLSALTKEDKERLLWHQKLLSNKNKKYLRNLPFCFEFYMSGSLVRVFHATPSKDDGLVLSFDPIEEKASLFEPSSRTISDKNADIAIYGHIHYQYMDKLYNKTLINAGSVGNAFDGIKSKSFSSNIKETTNAHYLIIEGEYKSKRYGGNFKVEFVRLPYDIDKELKKLENNLEPVVYEKELKEGIYRDTPKLDKIYKEKNIILRQ